MRFYSVETLPIAAAEPPLSALGQPRTRRPAFVGFLGPLAVTFRAPAAFWQAAGTHAPRAADFACEEKTTKTPTCQVRDLRRLGINTDDPIEILQCSRSCSIVCLCYPLVAGERPDAHLDSNLTRGVANEGGARQQGLPPLSATVDSDHPRMAGAGQHRIRTDPPSRDSQFARAHLRYRPPSRRLARGGPLSVPRVQTGHSNPDWL